ncbi:type I-E CRISPR-associated protein Cas6/Cse3/CasE [Herbidospora sp. NEAU-GS84]|uniref:Type I-E CRISPR-associated protein Cas6/Cse3/CasE n=1 Tax=Herbidospora solisilvae TaxID=2696284 RepID=A0A7C9JDB6_9ACTN|nr:type I-E CRISPR-associated protein Cas6/Cse3/CasE [Herbidospora solisilvae]NAS22183.1 type I-E CRISPR-associated protein Cas6/Cse3/CasE [Herbidospora solisilvae]
MTIWLTRIVVEPRCEAARRDLRDAEALHRRVMSLLPDGLGDQARNKAGVLYRQDDSANTGHHLLIQTALPVDFGKLPDRYGTLATRDLTPLLEALTEGTHVNYRIVANTTKRLGRNADRPGKLVSLRGESAEQWWHDRAAANGLLLHTVTATDLPDIRGRQKKVTHAATRFDGVATIKDAELVRQAVAAGIGKGKAYGCGLLSLAPVLA